MEKRVLLFSGGFDSMLQEFLLKPDVLLYVDMKTTYSDMEIEQLHRLPKSYTDRLIIKELPLGEYERANMYLPYRNLILGTIAMEYGQHVYFGFNSSDNAPDKDQMFIDKTTSLFKHLNKNCEVDMNWSNNHFSFNAPFKKYSKTQLVKQCIEKGMDVEFIRNIRTCYDGVSEKGCGVCQPCIRKAAALIINGISIDGLFDEPITAETLRKELELIDEGELDPKKYYYEYRQAFRLLSEKE